MAKSIDSVGIVYEHPEWFQLLFTELERRGIPVVYIHADRLAYDPESNDFPSLIVNRMSPSSWKRGHGNGLFAVRDYLAHVEERGVPVVNGSHAYGVELSKARQLDILRRAGVSYPKARVINHPSLAAEAAKGLRFPVVVKPNIGGSGAGIVRFDTPEELATASAAGTIDLGVDGVGLVQEFLPARGGSIVRVEVLDGEFLYAIQIWPDNSNFNLCPADICQQDAAAPAEDLGVCPAEPKKKLRIEGFQPPREAIEGALALARAASLDVGGIEYLIDDRTGEINYYDINALSNFVTDAVNVVGFDPTARFVDYLERRLARVLEPELALS
ncbi:MAG: hypothetical protein ABI823_12205 [Bryobacteraceae bacterium]